MLPAPLGLDVSLGLIGVLFKRLHGTLHLAFLGGHRVESPSNRELPANLLIVSSGYMFALEH